jgi:hypothetical protein
MDKATERPWRVVDSRLYTIAVKCAKKPYGIATMDHRSDGSDKANAALIVKAVNSFALAVSLAQAVKKQEPMYKAGAGQKELADNWAEICELATKFLEAAK